MPDKVVVAVDHLTAASVRRTAVMLLVVAVLASGITLLLIAVFDPLGGARRDDVLSAASVGVTLNGCQKGNELRRAVDEIARIQTNRTALVPRTEPPVIDEDAISITPCRAVVIQATGVDPGPVSDFVGEP